MHSSTLDLILFSETPKTFTLTLESLLYGHSDWVYSTRWATATLDPAIGAVVQPLKFLSASADKSLILWEYEAEEGAWVNTARVGEMGGSTLGFLGGSLNAEATAILAQGYSGGFHLWTQLPDGQWSAQVCATGHVESVQSVSWSPDGKYLLSTSKDQTTRVFAPWTARNNTWHEISRPQIHGYDLQCISMLDPCTLVSGAEEKVKTVSLALVADVLIDIADL